MGPIRAMESLLLLCSFFIHCHFTVLFSYRNEMLSAEEQKAHNPPASLVPRIHAVHITKIQSTNPLITADTKQRE